MRTAEEIREYDRGRNGDPHRLEARRAYQKTEQGRVAAFNAKKAYRARNQQKYIAHNLVNNALRNGKLIRPTGCERCSETTKVEAHHPDYSQPLNVIWVCDTCHKGIHNAEREARRGMKKRSSSVRNDDQAKTA